MPKAASKCCPFREIPSISTVHFSPIRLVLFFVMTDKTHCLHSIYIRTLSNVCFAEMVVNWLLEPLLNTVLSKNVFIFRWFHSQKIHTKFDVMFSGREDGSVENIFYVQTSVRRFRFDVKAKDMHNPYWLQPFVGVRL